MNPLYTHKHELSAHFTPAPTPAPPIPFPLHVHNHLHIPALEELHRALAHVLQVRRGGGNHVDDA